MTYKHTYSGYFQDHYLRSFPEFMVALQLTYLEHKKFKTESIRLSSRSSQGIKIPDFIVYDCNDVAEIIEVKHIASATEATIVDYSTRQLAMPNVKHRFITMSRASIRRVQLQSAKAAKHGFANGMYGKTHSWRS